jgi:hypothetical protein
VGRGQAAHASGTESAVRAIVHIGTEKTGSTALQSWLTRHAAALAEHGVHVATSLGAPAATGAAVYAAGLAAGGDVLRRAGIADADDLAAFRRALEQAFADEAAGARAAGAHTVVVSSEHFHSRLLDAGQVARLGRLLAPQVDEVEAVGLLRPQADLVRSVQTNHAMWGLPLSAETFRDTAAFVYSSRGYYDYLGLFRRWSDAWPGAFTLAPYARTPNAIAWLAGHLGLPRSLAEARGAVRIAGKERIDLETGALLNLVNRHLEIGPRDGPLRARIVGLAGDGAPLTYSRRDAEAVTQEFGAENEALCRAVPGLSPEDLVPDKAAYPEEGSVERIDEVDLGPRVVALLRTMGAGG